jgi:hypothetical protein
MATKQAEAMANLKRDWAAASKTEQETIKAQHEQARGLLSAISQATDVPSRQRLLEQALSTGLFQPEQLTPEALQSTINSLKVGDWVAAEGLTSQRTATLKAQQAAAEAQATRAQRPEASKAPLVSRHTNAKGEVTEILTDAATGAEVSRRSLGAIGKPEKSDVLSDAAEAQRKRMAAAGKHPESTDRSDRAAAALSDRFGARFDRATKGYRDVDSSYRVIQQAKNANYSDPAQRRGAQLNALYAYIKILDPESVVREGEIKLSREGDSLLNQIAFSAKRIAKEGSITDANFKALLAGADANYAARRARYIEQIKDMHTVASRLGANPERVFAMPKEKLDALMTGGAGAADSAGDAPPAVEPPKVRMTIRARDSKGKLHEAEAGTPLPSGWTLEK